jgi:hypothetical protein
VLEEALGIGEQAREWNRLDDAGGAVAIPGEYLESVGERV